MDTHHTPEQLGLTFTELDLVTVEELWNAATQALFGKFKEDRRIERKPAGIHAHELAEYFSMWANTIDGGLIVIGVENDGEFSGCDRSGTRVNRLEKSARDSCPDALADCKLVKGVRVDGKADYALVFRVHYHEKKVVKTSGGDAFIRSGESKRRLKPEEIRELEIGKGQVDIEQEPCPTYTFPDDFNITLVNDFVESARIRADYPEHLNTVDILELRRLGKRKASTFIPNTACVLLFAKDPMLLFAGCHIRFLRHEGETEGTGEAWNAVKDITLEGPIPMLIEEATSVLASQLREFSRLGTDGKFYTAPEYPKLAWYEAVVNACVHRSYGPLKNMNIFIRMFDDRLEIESPGGFPPPVTPANIYEMHHPRNPILMGAMQFLNYVKCAREGTRRMRQTLSAAELPPPHFAQKENLYSVVKVTLRNNVKQRAEWVDSDVTAIIGEEAAKALSTTERRAVNFIHENGGTTVSDIQRLLKNDWRTSQKLLIKLTNQGVLTHNFRTDIDRDPQGRYFLVPAPRARTSTDKG